jgi:hypothetical protein
MRLLLACIISGLLFIPCLAKDKIQIKNQNKCTTQTAQRGCCSHHGGVCGCSNGRQACCDGTLSPSCRCLKDDNIENKKSNSGFKS